MNVIMLARRIARNGGEGIEDEYEYEYEDEY